MGIDSRIFVIVLVFFFFLGGGGWILMHIMDDRPKAFLAFLFV